MSHKPFEIPVQIHELAINIVNKFTFNTQGADAKGIAELYTHKYDEVVNLLMNKYPPKPKTARPVRVKAF